MTIFDDEKLIAAHDSKTLLSYSSMRTNILSWIDFEEGQKVLLVNSDCQIIEDYLRSKKLVVEAVKYEEGGFSDVKGPIDYVISIGSFYNDLFSEAKTILGDGGRLICALSNDDGLMFKAGVPRFYAGQAGHSAKRDDIVKAIAAAGFEKYTWYYPYPDYRITSEIFSDRYLPKKGSITERTPSYEGDYIIALDEVKELNSAIENGLFTQVANSYLILCEKTKALGDDTGSEDRQLDFNKKGSMIYAKYNSMRDPKYRLCTGIYETKTGRRHVEKWAEDERANEHLLSIAKKGRLLSDSYNMLKFVPCRMSGERVRFEFVEGRPLVNVKHLVEFEHKTKEKIVEKIVAALEAAFISIFSTECDNIVTFLPNREFMEYFDGNDARSMVGLDAYKISNADCILSNFLLGDEIYCLDYEWIFDFPVPEEYLKYRAIHYLFREESAVFDELEKSGIDISENDVLAAMGYEREEIEDCKALEQAYQLRIHGKDMRYYYLAHYKWRAWTTEEWAHEHSFMYRLRRKLDKLKK